MKKTLLQIFVLLISWNFTMGQEIHLQNMITETSPGFQILDISPSGIERPTNPGEFALKLFDLTNNGSAIPKNFALEISPYWFFRPGEENIYKYLNLKPAADPGSAKVLEGNAVGGILRKLSISFASALIDSDMGSLLANTNYVSVGARTRLISINGKRRIDSLSSAFQSIRRSIALAGFKEGGGVNSPDKIEETLKFDPAYQLALQNLSMPPLFQVDLAYAYSEAFPGNEFSTKRFNRDGLWLTATVTPISFNQKKLHDDLSLAMMGRLMKDELLTDSLHGIFQKKTAFDIGAKIEYDIKRLTVSFEYIRRSFQHSKEWNSTRTVGALAYRVNESLYVIASWGKNFGKRDNLFALVGLNWGLGSNSIKL